MKVCLPSWLTQQLKLAAALAVLEMHCRNVSKGSPDNLSVGAAL